MAATATDRDTVIVAAHVPRDQREALRALARVEDRSVSWVLRRAIANELDRAGQTAAAFHAPIHVTSEGDRP
jgi:predicted transcriptional regulator